MAKKSPHAVARELLRAAEIYDQRAVPGLALHVFGALSMHRAAAMDWFDAVAFAQQSTEPRRTHLLLWLHSHHGDLPFKNWQKRLRALLARRRLPKWSCVDFKCGPGQPLWNLRPITGPELVAAWKKGRKPKPESTDDHRSRPHRQRISGAPVRQRGRAQSELSGLAGAGRKARRSGERVVSREQPA